MSTLMQFLEKETKGVVLGTGGAPPVLFQAPDEGTGYSNTGAALNVSLRIASLKTKPAWDMIAKFAAVKTIADTNYNTIIDENNVMGYLITCICPGVATTANTSLKITIDGVEVEFVKACTGEHRMILGNVVGSKQGRVDQALYLARQYNHGLQIIQDNVIKLQKPYYGGTPYFIIGPHECILAGNFIPFGESVKVEMKTDSLSSAFYRDHAAVVYIKI